MRIHARLLLGMFGLAVSRSRRWRLRPRSATTMADATTADSLNGQPQPQPQPQSQPAPHRHHGLFGRRHCVECQRAYVKAHDGVDVPAPPPIETGAMMHGQVDGRTGELVSDLPGERGRDGTGHDRGCSCSRLRGGRWPGRDGERRCSRLRGRGRGRLGPRPGADRRLEVGSGTLWRSPHGRDGPSSGAGGSYDPSVVPTSIPPAQVAMEGLEHERPADH